MKRDEHKCMEQLFEKVGIPTDTDIEILLKCFKINATEIIIRDDMILCNSPKGEIAINFSMAYSYKGWCEIWIVDKDRTRRYAVVPETEEHPWYTIYLGSDVSVDGKKLTSYICEDVANVNVAKWTISKEPCKDIMEITIVSSSEYYLYQSAIEIEEPLISYLKSDAEMLDASEVYCWMMHALPAELTVEQTISIDILVYGKINDIEEITSMVRKKNGELEAFITTSPEEGSILIAKRNAEDWKDVEGNELLLTGIGWKWQDGEQCVDYIIDHYSFTMEINEIQKVSEHVTNLLERAERTVNKYMPLFE